MSGFICADEPNQQPHSLFPPSLQHLLNNESRHWERLYDQALTYAQENTLERHVSAHDMGKGANNTTATMQMQCSDIAVQCR